jgi:hypothetical protein
MFKSEQIKKDYRAWYLEKIQAIELLCIESRKLAWNKKS